MENKIATIEKEEFVLSEQHEEYLQIYHEYFVLRWDWADICRYHNCSKAKVTKAVRWVIDNKLKFPSKFLIKGAIDAITARLKNNQALYEMEIYKKRYRDNAFIVSLVREIREDEKVLLKLQEIYHADDEDSEKLSASQVLRLITEAKTGNKTEETKEEVQE